LDRCKDELVLSSTEEALESLEKRDDGAQNVHFVAAIFLSALRISHVRGLNTNMHHIDGYPPV
jgi:hypothetical protein